MEDILVQFKGCYRWNEFPNIQKILAKGLNAKPKKHPVLDKVTIGMATDELISMWQYEDGK